MNEFLKKFILILVELVVIFVVAYLFAIEPTKKYEWFAGIFHGIWAIPNYVISLLVDNYLIKAQLYTRLYNTLWWILLVISALYYINVLYRTANIFKKDRYDRSS